jgi:tetratricopeptide (TPR) repeat protein
MFYRGRIYEKRGNLQAALADYERACILSPGWQSACVAAAFAGGRIAHEAKDYTTAIAKLTKAIAIQGGNWADLFNLRAASYDALNRLDEAFADYDRAVKLSPDWSSPMFYRGRIYEKRGNLQAALADYERACTLSPEWESPCSSRDRLRLRR